MAADVKCAAFLVCLAVLLLCSFPLCCGRCPDNFFGKDPDCAYRCHCRNWRSCDAVRGVCLTGGCAKEYAGPSCQYVNFARDRTPSANFSISAGTENLSKCVDGDPSTCFLENGQSNLPLIIDIEEDSWADVISIHLSKQFLETGRVANANTLKVTYYDRDNTSEVVHPHLTKPNDTSLTYRLPEPAVVTRVQIRATGPVSLALCEVTVLGGRNLAIRKNAAQGEEIYKETYKSFGADLAVDGYTHTHFDGDSCSHTQGDSGQHSWWTVFLGRFLNIWRLKVYTRQDYEPERMARFRVNVTMGNGTHVQVYQHSNTTPDPLTDIVLPQPLAVSDVTVWHQETGRTVWLCEVEVYGDCQDGYYGWQCEKRCQCQDAREVCDKMWGYCPHSGCRPGFRGDDCTLQCVTGRYGKGCAKNCSDGCVNDTCHHVTGNCTNGCKSGWMSPRCDQKCHRGYYGEDCGKMCSTGCRNGRCDHVTGDCEEGCLPGWLGELCDETCDAGFYGDNCNMTCSSDCVNSSCEAISGHCLFGCWEGVSGDMCEKAGQRAEEAVPWPIIGGAVGGAVLLIVLLVIIGVVCLFRRSKPKLSLQKRRRDDYENSSDILMGSLAAQQQEGGTENTANAENALQTENCLYANETGKSNKAFDGDTTDAISG